MLLKRVRVIGVDLTGILGGRMAGLTNYYKSPAVDKKHIFYTVMQVISCLKFCNMTKSGDDPPLQILGDLCPVPPVIYAHG